MYRNFIPVAVRALCLLLLLALVACAPSRPGLERLTFAPLEFHPPEVEIIELPSGVRLYLKEDHELPLVEISALVGAGSISVPADETGMAGIFAALLRTGGAGERGPEELEEALERLAADLSVATETYTTGVDLSLRTEDLAPGLAILADLLRRPGFDPRRLEIARQQAIEAVRRQNDLPDSIADRALMQAIYGDHPLGRYPTVESLQQVERDDLIAFHQHYFHPNNLWLAVSGDFQRGELLRLLDEAFAGWAPAEVARQEIPPLQEVGPAAVRVADKAIPQATILVGELGIDKDHPDLHAVRVMNYILGGGGFNSRLMREIRSNRGLAYSVYSTYQVGRRLPGPFVAGTETKTSSTLEAVGLLRQIMEEMRTTAVTEQELTLARESLVNSFVFAFTDTHSVVTQQMRLDWFDYPPDYLVTFRDKVAAVTADDVLRVARRHLNPERQNIVLVGDRKQMGDLSVLDLPVETIEP
ncbi:MAG: insulinase family protein [Desulfuromonadales bacterium]|nr:insulinase family protein [Desulfuromonadales bacterium]